MNEQDQYLSMDRILELKEKILQEDYISQAIQEIARQLTEGLNKGHFQRYERK